MCIWHACPDRCGKFASGGKGTQKIGKGEEAMAKNLLAPVDKAGGEFELVEREIPSPGPGEVRISVKACRICFSDRLRACLHRQQGHLWRERSGRPASREAAP